MESQVFAENVLHLKIAIRSFKNYVYHHFNSFWWVIMSPQPKGRRGHIAFGEDPVDIAHCLLSYLLNQWVDFDQICTDTLLGGRKEVISFWWPWPHFQDHTSSLKFSPKKLVCTLSLEPNDGFWPNFIYCNVGMIWSDFGDLYLIFKVTTLSPEPIGGFWPNLHRNTIGIWEERIRFWRPWPDFEGQTSTLNVKAWPKQSLSTLCL